MPKVNLEDLKNEYIGKTFNWLTVLDVIRDGTIKFVCKCRCGNAVTSYYKKILSNHTTSCGCYKHSKEKADKYKKWCEEIPNKVKERSNKLKQWCKENPDKLKEKGIKHSKYYKDNPGVGVAAGKRYKEWCRNNPEKIKEKTERRASTYVSNPNIQESANNKLKEFYKAHNDLIDKLVERTEHRHFQTRLNADYSDLLEVIHQDYVDDLLKGNIKADSIIKTKCPMCGNYVEHKFNNIYRLDKHCFKNGSAPLCLNCKNLYNSSKSEQEIADYISTFYNGELIRNSREIISPLELDLYYPEKKIAIEFNGDYWHSEEFKDSLYHYSKYIECKNRYIILVSIFESEWDSNKNKIKQYLLDLFNGNENNLSFDGTKNNKMNNNYPSMQMYKKQSVYEESFYMFNNIRVFTCGYSIIF